MKPKTNNGIQQMVKVAFHSRVYKHCHIESKILFPAIEVVCQRYTRTTVLQEALIADA